MSILRTTIPYSLDDMRAMITAPDAEIIIDYDNSKLQGTAALIYLTNVNLHRPRLETSNKQAAYQLIDNYITLKSVLYVASLVYSVAGLLLYKSGCYDQLSQEEQQEIEQNGLLTKEDFVQYLEDPTRAKNLDALLMLMNSILLFAVSCSVEFTEAFGNVEDQFEVIDDVNYTGFTFVHLLKQETFVYNFYGVPSSTPPAFFKQQFKEYMYNGKSLFSILYEKQSPIIPLLDCLLKQTITPSMIVEAHHELMEAAA